LYLRTYTAVHNSIISSSVSSQRINTSQLLVVSPLAKAEVHIVAFYDSQSSYRLTSPASIHQYWRSSSLGNPTHVPPPQWPRLLDYWHACHSQGIFGATSVQARILKVQGERGTAFSDYAAGSRFWQMCGVACCAAGPGAQSRHRHSIRPPRAHPQRKVRSRQGSSCRLRKLLTRSALLLTCYCALNRLALLPRALAALSTSVMCQRTSHTQP
jgi:hypothetical protein